MPAAYACTQVLPAAFHHTQAKCNRVQVCSRALLQVSNLTHLHSLDFDYCWYLSHQYAPLAALGSTLQSLTLDNCTSLPDCLPNMMALRTLVSMV